MLHGNFVHGQLVTDTEDLRSTYKHGFHYQALVKLEGMTMTEHLRPLLAEYLGD